MSNHPYSSLSDKWALVTGATAGIGQAIATSLAQVGCNLLLTGRREERLIDLKKLLESTNDIHVETYSFDVRSSKECEEFAQNAPLDKLDILVNNAGLAMGFHSIYEANIDHWDTMIDTNVKGLLYISRLVIPHFVKKNAGFVLNIGSLAGYDAYANGSAYCATKFAVRAINEAMKKDLHGTAVRVSMLSPGLVETEFSEVRFEGDKDKAAKVYDGFEPLTANDIADIALFTLSRPAHVNILESLVLPTAQSASTMVDRRIDH